jgi:hypothetical protein
MTSNGISYKKHVIPVQYFQFPVDFQNYSLQRMLQNEKKEVNMNSVMDLGIHY